MKNNLATILFLMLFLGASAQKQHYPSYNGLVMAGYQGWFNTPGDSAGRHWHHYELRGVFAPGSCEIDFWPDVREYPKVYKTSFQYTDGQPASVFSPSDHRPL